ncbi:hypothetical protein O7634_03460 [Micromonospora sp. WMMD1120]|uniref:hypothetical protein n=1 Tax=Micromonospora sp. WMMD1120 TaxID=3016106 RepID=UPI00241703AB|nr:hypothetical protein [Micromonospora sp. WMMD1120]MDG4805810.1 hypothetical protein [Micromonospora sp. WMMD1120]
MVNPTLEMRRLAGKVAVLLAGVYVLVVFGAAVATASGDGVPWWGWLLLPLPAVPFVPSVTAAARLHRTSDPERTRALWRRSLGFAGVGLVLVIVVALVLNAAGGS